MALSKMHENQIVKFYSNPALHPHKKKLIADQHEQAFQEGKKAWELGYASCENPYSRTDGDAIWNKYDCWLEGWMSAAKELL